MPHSRSRRAPLCARARMACANFPTAARRICTLGTSGLYACTEVAYAGDLYGRPVCSCMSAICVDEVGEFGGFLVHALFEKTADRHAVLFLTVRAPCALCRVCCLRAASSSPAAPAIRSAVVSRVERVLPRPLCAAPFPFLPLRPARTSLQATGAEAPREAPREAH